MLGSSVLTYMDDKLYMQKHFSDAAVYNVIRKKIVSSCCAVRKVRTQTRTEVHGSHIWPCVPSHSFLGNKLTVKTLLKPWIVYVMVQCICVHVFELFVYMNEKANHAMQLFIFCARLIRMLICINTQLFEIFHN